MRRASAISLAVLSVAAALTSPAIGSPVVPSLSGRTVIVVGPGSVSEDVSVRSSVSLAGQCFPEPAFSAVGSADAVMAVLIPRASNNATSAIVSFGRFPRSGGGQSFSTLCGSRILDAGKYQLVVLHTPGTATITLRLPGLKGSTTLHPRGASRAHLRVLPRVGPYDAASAATATYGAVDELEGGGLVEAAGWVRQLAPSELTTFGECDQRQSATPVTDALVFAPGCPLS